MSQLFRRVGRLVRAELNSRRTDSDSINFNEGTALVAGGAVAGTSIGKVGILAGGTGYSVGTIPLAAAGALTGAALYEALRSLIEGDTSSIGAAAMGAAAGAATSAMTGGIGVAAGGATFGVGMASMAATGAVVGLGVVGLNRLLQQGIDPENLLDIAIEQMQDELKALREAMINMIATQKRTQQKIVQAQAEVKKWQQQAQLALQQENDALAREALVRRNHHLKAAESLQACLDEYAVSVKKLKRDLINLEAKVSEATSKKDPLKSKIRAVRANQHLHSTVDRLGASSELSTFERMEDKVLQMEARSQAAAELVGNSLEEQFALLESGSGVDEELEAMKAQFLGSVQQAQTRLPGNASETANTDLKDVVVDDELEALKTQLDNLC